MGRKPKIVDPGIVSMVPEGKKYQCLRCGKEYSDATGHFYKITHSELYKANDRYCPLCKDCVNELFDTFARRYNNEKTACIILCHMLDVPFFNTLFDSIAANNNTFSMGLMLRVINGRQYQYQNFSNTLVTGELNKNDSDVREEVEAKWSKTDKQNKAFAISVVGYDPFENCGMTENDRKYAFNILAGYCDVDGIQEDGHKIQSVLQIAQSQLQCRKLDELINSELLSNAPDDNRIKSLAATKKDLQNGILKIAQDNNIASKYNSNSAQGKNTLSQKMKDLATDGYEPIKVNLFDIKTSDAMRQVADLSNQSIMEQIPPDANDYSAMLKEQRTLIQKFESERDQYQEENRLLKNELADLKSKKSR